MFWNPPGRAQHSARGWKVLVSDVCDGQALFKKHDSISEHDFQLLNIGSATALLMKSLRRHFQEKQKQTDLRCAHSRTTVVDELIPTC